MHGVSLSRRTAAAALAAAALAGLVATATAQGGVTSSSARAAADPAPRHVVGRGTSSNWSGYAVDGTNATAVAGTWTQQRVTCAPGENSWSSPWVGIDGDASSTVEQIGTDSDCQKGTPVYYAWYEMYPKSLVTIPLTVSPNDSITGRVTYAGGVFTLSLTDNTTGASFAAPPQTSTKAQRTSVEWIVEGPSNGQLSNFGTVPFTNDSATIGGATGALGSFAGTQPITMVGHKNVIRAVPSSPIGAGGAFTDTWQHS